MPFDSSGTYNRVIPGGWKADAQAGIKIRADRHDDEDDGFAVGLSTCITKDGRTQPTANLPMNGKRHTNVGEPVDPSDGSTKKYVDDRFGTVFNITGIDEAGRIAFSGSQSPLATGKPLGLSFTQADLFFGVKPLDVESVGKPPRWVWNDKADGLGYDVMSLTDTNILTLARKDDGAASGPNFTLKRESASPAASDILGIVQFQGKNSVAADVAYGQIYVSITDPVVNTHDANMNFTVAVAGAITPRLTLSAAGASVTGALSTSGNLTTNAVTCDGITAAGNINATGSVTAGGNMSADNYAIGANGVFNSGSLASAYVKANHFCKSGTAGGYGANSFNMLWSGSAMILFVDNTNVGTINTTSDYRIKKDVAELPSTWDRVKALRPVSYTQAAFATVFAADDIERWGFIAHETQDTLVPTTASGAKDMEDGVQGLNWAPILAATVKALQEAMQRIEALETQLAGAP